MKMYNDMEDNAFNVGDAHNPPNMTDVLMFCRVMTAQVDYIIALGDEDNYMMWKKKTM